MGPSKFPQFIACNVFRNKKTTKNLISISTASCPTAPAVILSVSGILQTPKATGSAASCSVQLLKQKIVFTVCCVSARCVPGMLLMGVTLRNIPHVTDWVFIDVKWSASLRNIALAIILARAGLGLDPTVRHRHYFS